MGSQNNSPPPKITSKYNHSSKSFGKKPKRLCSTSVGFRSDPRSIAIMKQENRLGSEINLLMNHSFKLAKAQKIWAGFPPGLGGMGHIIMINLPCPPLLLSSSLGMLGECRYLMTVQTLRRLPCCYPDTFRKSKCNTPNGSHTHTETHTHTPLLTSKKCVSTF